MLFDNKPPPVRKYLSLDEYAATASQSMGAAFEQSWTETPINSIYRDQELIRANVGKGEVKYGHYSPSRGQNIILPQGEKKLTKEAAKSQIDAKGLSLIVPDEGYTQAALDIVISRKEDELRRKSQMNASRGLVPEVGKFAAAMAAQVLDPINVASAFIPVVAPSKYAAMLKASATATQRAGVRLAVGGAEGLVGAAIVEPIIYMAKEREQADYTMTDSLVNVGLGSVFGAGLHAGAGAVGDAIKRAKLKKTKVEPVENQGYTAERVSTAAPETREAMLKTSLAQEAEGVSSNVDAVASHDPNLSRVESQPVRSQSDDPMLGDADIDTASAQDVPPPSELSKAQSLENAVTNNVKRGADTEAPYRADEVIAKDDINIDDELTFYTESITATERSTGIKADSTIELDDAIIKAESDALALEAAVTCRITK